MTPMNDRHQMSGTARIIPRIRRPRPPHALMMFLLVGAGNGAFAQPLSTPVPATLATVVVDAGHPWVASGLTVRTGDRLIFRTTGTIKWGPEPDQVSGPDGHVGKSGKLGEGGLIGRVGSTGKPFAIGASGVPIVMKKGGALFLGINDFIFSDNDGAFVVTIVRAP